jgi:hypothetical protein
MPYLTELSRRATVYKFGVRWHWKCGATRDQTGLCLGGPAPTHEDAYRAAFDHITDEHCEQLVVPTDPDGCRYCGVIHRERDLQVIEPVGVHGYRSPTKKQRANRLSQARPVR